MNIAPEAVAALPILLSSLLGSPHCAGMCGGFVAIYSHGTNRHVTPHLLYSLGRLTTYLSLGLAAATIGSSIDSLSGVARFSSLLVGSTLIAIGLFRITGINSDFFSSAFRWLTAPISRLTKPVFSMKSEAKPFLIGLITTLLPCGWLYAFVALALSSANPLTAIEIMTLFWVGTLPIMLSVGFIAKSLTQKLSHHLPRIVGVLLIFGGLISLNLHLQHANHNHQDHMHHLGR